MRWLKRGCRRIDGRRQAVYDESMTAILDEPPRRGKSLLSSFC